MSQLNEALESPPSDAEAEPEPTNPVDSAASHAVGGPARAALVFNVVGITLVLAGFGAIGLGLWALRPALAVGRPRDRCRGGRRRHARISPPATAEPRAPAGVKLPGERPDR